MNDINNGYDRWLTTPPDEEEAVICEYCNQEMEYYMGLGEAYTQCDNQFCPEKFEKYKGGTIEVVMDMATHLAEVEQELRETKTKLKSTQNTLSFVRAKLSATQETLTERYATIEFLEAQIDKHNEKVLTHSQSKGE